VIRLQNVQQDNAESIVIRLQTLQRDNAESTANRLQTPQRDSVEQRFPNCGPRRTSGRRVLSLWSS
jgi:hypothetical protein